MLKAGQKGVIQSITYQKGGDWIVFVDKNGELKQFPLWSHFTYTTKKSLGELIEEEFKELVKRLPFLPEAELFECYEILKEVYQNAR